MLRVLIIENNLLVGAGVQVLLTNVVGLDITGASPQSSHEMVRAMEQLKPNVVILDESSPFVTPLKFFHLFMSTSQFRVIIVSANSDVVQIFGNREVLVTDATQFIDIVCTVETAPATPDEKGAPAENIKI